MCTQCGCGDTAVTIKATVRVAPGENASLISGFDVPPPYGKGKE
jgi:hypothetical protein